MKASELRKQTREELNSTLSDLARERFNLKMQKATGQLSKPDQMRKVRRNIARVHTILTEMARAE